jgi:triosephosphate isomerase
MYSNSKNYLIAANWKMNTLVSECRSLAIAATDLSWTDELEILICPPFTHLQTLQSLQLDGIRIGAQNCHHQIKGAYTGEISVDMLKDLNCDYVIIGHSERRMMNSEENEIIHLKIKLAIESGLQIIYCCGETSDARNKNHMKPF